MAQARFLKPDQLAEVFGVTTGTIREWVREGKIPCIRLSPASIRFELDEVLRALRADASRERPPRTAVTEIGQSHDESVEPEEHDGR